MTAYWMVRRHWLQARKKMLMGTATVVQVLQDLFYQPLRSVVRLEFTSLLSLETTRLFLPNVLIIDNERPIDRLLSLLTCRRRRRRSVGESASSANQSRRKGSRTRVESLTTWRRQSKLRRPAMHVSSPELNRLTRARLSNTSRQTAKSQLW